MLTLIVVLVVIAAVVVFSVQNAAPVSVAFLVWKYEASLAVVVLLSVACGLLIGAAMVSFWRLRRAMRERKAAQPGTSGEEPGI